MVLLLITLSLTANHQQTDQPLQPNRIYIAISDTDNYAIIACNPGTNRYVGIVRAEGLTGNGNTLAGLVNRKVQVQNQKRAREAGDAIR